MFAAILFLSLFTHHTPVPHEITLSGQLAQGGLVDIKAPEDTEIKLDDNEIDSVAPGHYLIGFGRDAAPVSKLTINYPDGKSEEHTLNIKQTQYVTQYINGVDNTINNPLPDTETRIVKEVFQLAEARHMGDYPCPGKLNFIRPAPGRITAYFGSSRVYNGTPGRPHSGVDFAGNIGDPALAPEDGKIVFYQNMVLTGNTLAIDHGCGVVSTLMHLSSAEKQVGDTVKKGEIVARIGKTGIATGSHLHWSLNLGSTRLDPLLVLQ